MRFTRWQQSDHTAIENCPGNIDGNRDLIISCFVDNDNVITIVSETWSFHVLLTTTMSLLSCLRLDHFMFCWKGQCHYYRVWVGTLLIRMNVEGGGCPHRVYQLCRFHCYLINSACHCCGSGKTVSDHLSAIEWNTLRLCSLLSNASKMHHGDCKEAFGLPLVHYTEYFIVGLTAQLTDCWLQQSPIRHRTNDSTTTSESKQLFVPTKHLPKGWKHALQLSAEKCFLIASAGDV